MLDKLHVLPNYDLISHFTLELVQQFTDEDGSTYCESIEHSRVVDPRATSVFWTIYQVFDPELHPERFAGSEAIADFQIKVEADSVFDFLTKALNTLKSLREFREVLSKELLDL